MGLLGRLRRSSPRALRKLSCTERYRARLPAGTADAVCNSNLPACRLAGLRGRNWLRQPGRLAERARGPREDAAT